MRFLVSFGLLLAILVNVSMSQVNIGGHNRGLISGSGLSNTGEQPGVRIGGRNFGRIENSGPVSVVGRNFGSGSGSNPGGSRFGSSRSSSFASFNGISDNTGSGSNWPKRWQYNRRRILPGGGTVVESGSGFSYNRRNRNGFSSGSSASSSSFYNSGRSSSSSSGESQVYRGGNFNLNQGNKGNPGSAFRRGNWNRNRNRNFGRPNENSRTSETDQIYRGGSWSGNNNNGQSRSGSVFVPGDNNRDIINQGNNNNNFGSGRTFGSSWWNNDNNNDRNNNNQRNRGNFWGNQRRFSGEGFSGSSFLENMMKNLRKRFPDSKINVENINW